MASSHNHSSPYYSSPSWGVWAFQDVFDVRFYNYYAEQMAEAVEQAAADLKPVRVGASVSTFDKTPRHSFGPAIADDGSPAGYPTSDTDHDVTVIRFDDITDPGSPKPLATLVNFALHPEFLDGNDLISADYLGPLQRMTDRATGGITIWTQGAVGTAEPERSSYHSIHERLEFTHREYGQAEYGARLMSNAIVDTWRDIELGTPERPASFVPFDSDFADSEVAMQDRWFPGPITHPYPGISNCRTDEALAGEPQLPIVGLPDCQSVEEGLNSLAGLIGLPEPGDVIPPIDPGLTTDDFQRLGIPVPENYSAPSFTGLQEDINVHLQAFRIGDILFTACSCEQWADQSRNIRTRTDRVAGNEYLGYDWKEHCTPNNDGTYGGGAEGYGTGTWTCPNPGNPAQNLPPLSDQLVERMHRQVTNPANGWNDVDYVLQADSEPTDVREIKGNYTHDDDAASAARGYRLTVPLGMTNDYNGYIATYREYQRGDHYRKALTGWGPHSSDYMATRLVNMGRVLNGGNAAQLLPAEYGDGKIAADMAHNDARAEALGTTGGAAIDAYEAALPDDGGEAAGVTQPMDIERFDGTFFTWVGGSNFTDNPRVKVEREVQGTWQDWAGQSGEIPVTVEYPEGPDTPSYETGSFEWRWTAHFEAFAARFETIEGVRATPAGALPLRGRRRAAHGRRPGALPRGVRAVRGPAVGRDHGRGHPGRGRRHGELQRRAPDAADARPAERRDRADRLPGHLRLRRRRRAAALHRGEPFREGRPGCARRPEPRGVVLRRVRVAAVARLRRRGNRHRHVRRPGRQRRAGARRGAERALAHHADGRPVRERAGRAWMRAGRARQLQRRGLRARAHRRLRGRRQLRPAGRGLGRAGRRRRERLSARLGPPARAAPRQGAAGPAAGAPPGAALRAPAAAPLCRPLLPRRRRPHPDRLSIAQAHPLPAARPAPPAARPRGADPDHQPPLPPARPSPRRGGAPASRRRAQAAPVQGRLERLARGARQAQQPALQGARRARSRDRRGRSAADARAARRQALPEELLVARRLVLAAVAAALVAVPVAPAAAEPVADAAAQPKAKARALTLKRGVLAKRGRMRVRVRYRAAGRVRLAVRVRRPGTRRRATFARRRPVRFRRPGRRTVKLRLTRYGRRLARSKPRACVTLRLTVVARARRNARPRRPRVSRRRQRVRPLARAACSSRGPTSPGPSPPGPIRAGAASADITPPIGTPMFAYTARSNVANPDGLLQLIGDPDPDQNLYAKTFVPSEGIHTRVRARAIVIEQFGRKFALVQTDLGGLPYAMTQEVLRRVEDIGIERERLLLSATHTHASTGPIWPADSSGYALLGGDAFDPRVFEITVTGIAEAIRAADQNLESAHLGTASVELRDASRNRAFEAFRRNPDVPADEPGARAASIDPELTVIRVDTAAGVPIGAWSNFAIHPTSFGDENLLFSGDNVATAERVAERGMADAAANAGKEPPADRPPVNVWTNSNEGDISPNGGADSVDGDPLQYVPNSFASANMAGARVGAGILRAWREAGNAMRSEVALDARQTFVAFDGTPSEGSPVGPLQALGQGGITADDGTCNPLPANIPGQEPKFPLIAGAGLVPSVNPVSMWRIDDHGVLGLPAEVTKQMGRRLRDALVAQSGGALDNVALAGLSGGYVSYTSTPEEYDHCGYEGSFTLFGRQQGARWRDAAVGALGALLSGEPAAGAPEPPPLGLGVGEPGAVDATPTAGEAVAEPAATVNRMGRATFSWRGGDPAVDAPRGGDFVTLQRFEAGNWVDVETDDSEFDTTALGDEGVWTETWQFGECDTLGTHRFHVQGVADRGAGPEPYEVTSQSFVLQPTAPLGHLFPEVGGGVVTVAGIYPDPGAEILVALPRRVRSGSATLEVDGVEVEAPIDAERLLFTAPAPDGAAIEVVDIDDGCGNATP